MKTADVHIENYSSVILVTPHTSAARGWIAENVGGETTWYGGSLVVEPRYLADLVEGMRAGGLDVL